MADHEDPTPDWVVWAAITFMAVLLVILVGSTGYAMWEEWR